MKFVDELDDAQFQVSEWGIATRDDIILKVNRGSQPVINVDDDEENGNGDTNSASWRSSGMTVITVHYRQQQQLQLKRISHPSLRADK